MGANSTDYGKLMSILMQNIELKTLMLVPQNVFTNYGELRINYFVEGFVAEAIVIPNVCRLLIKNAPMSPTNSEFVKENNLIIEVFVPSSQDRLGGFERRTNLIIDKLIKLLHREWINDRRLSLVASNELNCSVVGFKRAYVQFSFKRVYS